jgi:hypothetical protein
MNQYDIGERLICVVDFHEKFAPNEIVTVEDITVKGSICYKFQGYKGWYRQGEVNRLFRLF